MGCCSRFLLSVDLLERSPPILRKRLMGKLLHDLMFLTAHKIHLEIIVRFKSPSHRSGSHHWAAAQHCCSMTVPNFGMAREKALCRKETRERMSEKLPWSIIGNDQFYYLAQLLIMFVQNGEIFYISFAVLLLHHNFLWLLQCSSCKKW